MLGGICVSKQKRLKKQLGTGYQFEQRFSAKNLARMLRRLEGSNHFRVAAILSAGAVRLEAVVYWDNGKYSLGYDLHGVPVPQAGRQQREAKVSDQVREYFTIWR